MTSTPALLSDAFQSIVVSKLNIILNWEIINNTCAVLESEDVNIKEANVVWKVSLQKLSSSELNFTFKMNRTVHTNSLKEHVFKVKVSSRCGQAIFVSADYFIPMSWKFSETINVSPIYTTLCITTIMSCRQKSIDTTNVTKRLVDINMHVLNDPTYAFIVDGDEFNVHKNILDANSPVFADIFKSNMKKSNDNTCVVKNIEPSIFGHMLKFVYGGILPKDINDISISLYGVAHFYQLKDLMDICKQVIRSNLSAANAHEVYVCANLYDLEDLKKDAMEIRKLVKPPTTQTLRQIIERKKHELVRLQHLEALAATLCNTQK